MSMPKRLCVGYALRPRTCQCLITQSLLDHAKNQGINLLQIDTTKPLSEQGPFDCIIHKLYGEEWNQQLDGFHSQNPDVIIVDSPTAVERLHNRISMLEVVSGLKISQEHEAIVSIPKQVPIYDSELLSSLKVYEGLKFPVIAKPLLANASANAHEMSLVFNSNGLKELEAPVLLQEFVNHGGVIFKVYVAGKYVKCVKRNSLPDISEEKLAKLGGLMPFSHISNMSNGEDKGDFEDVEMPALSFVNEVAKGLRETLGLSLFNFDMIRKAENHHCYLVIDINYFPGYEKLPSYESVLTDFLREITEDGGCEM